MYKVLIVDDEAEIRSALAIYYPWEALGFVVAGRAACVSEAKAIVGRETIDAVLCDIRMPGESGLEFAAWLAARRPAIKTVLLSAYREFEYAQEAFRYGVRGYLVKPPSDEEFRAVFVGVARELDEEGAIRRARGEGRLSSRGEAAFPGLLDAPEGTGAVSEALAALASACPDPRLADVVAYLRGNIGDACLKGAARAAGMNPTYFSTWYREKTGRAFSDSVTAFRMERAANLVIGREGRLADVGAIVGYSNPKNFSRAFRKHFGASPRAYRRASLAKGGAPVSAGSIDRGG